MVKPRGSHVRIYCFLCVFFLTDWLSIVLILKNYLYTRVICYEMQWLRKCNFFLSFYIFFTGSSEMYARMLCRKQMAMGEGKGKGGAGRYIIRCAAWPEDVTASLHGHTLWEDLINWLEKAKEGPWQWQIRGMGYFVSRDPFFSSSSVTIWLIFFSFLIKGQVS